MLCRFSCLSLLFCACGCSPSTSIDEDVVFSTHQWIEVLETEVTTGDFDKSSQTVQKIETQGSVSAQQLSDYLVLKARSHIGTSQYDLAASTINELERGADELFVVHLLRGELALKQGDQRTAKQEFTEARRQNPKFVIPNI